MPPRWRTQILRNLDGARFAVTIGALSEHDPAAFDCVVPVWLSAYRKLRRYHDVKNVLIPDAESVAIMNDKLRLMTLFSRIGYGELVPILLTEPQEYPFIYKKRIDAWGANSRIIYSRDELQAFEATITPDQYFKQEYVPGHLEYTTHILAVGGEVFFDSTFEFLFEEEHFVKGKFCRHKRVLKMETPFRDLLCKIVSDLNYTGTCCFNYKIKDGVPKIFEINPRFGATLSLDINRYLDVLLDLLAVRRRSRTVASSSETRAQSCV